MCLYEVKEAVLPLSTFTPGYKVVFQSKETPEHFYPLFFRELCDNQPFTLGREYACRVRGITPDHDNRMYIPGFHAYREKEPALIQLGDESPTSTLYGNTYVTRRVVRVSLYLIVAEGTQRVFCEQGVSSEEGQHYTQAPTVVGLSQVIEEVIK